MGIGWSVFNSLLFGVARHDLNTDSTSVTHSSTQNTKHKIGKTCTLISHRKNLFTSNLNIYKLDNFILELTLLTASPQKVLIFLKKLSPKGTKIAIIFCFIFNVVTFHQRIMRYCPFENLVTFLTTKF